MFDYRAAQGDDSDDGGGDNVHSGNGSDADNKSVDHYDINDDDKGASTMMAMATMLTTM